MICSTAYTFLVVGLASQMLAEPIHEPHQPSLARMSTRDIIGLSRRGVEGYSPTELLCGEGDTCAEACGKGFAKCDSKDHLTHCYNPSKKQECCPNGSGDSCDKGYFCSADEDNKTWCCPDGLSLKECAQKYDIPGALTSQSPSTTTSKTTTKATATKETSSKVSHTSTVSKETTTTKKSSTKETSTKESISTTTKVRKPESTETTESISTTKPSHHHPISKTKTETEESSTTTSTTTSSTIIAEETTSLITTPAVTAQTVASDPTTSATPAAATTSSVEQSGSGNHGPTGSLVLFIVGALVALV
ncbi:hypothetical protein NPX13_g11326 [Xylaria arbuscula]|uniref:Prp 4 CRoW domain-containing protein n=1 Tax=Xylaria arbuscula TaxID=114810 RepID=A0A9W8N3C7_9PEZI|nr:hypothetical protein NPX13_g11326 [Xylaria arbuscula]